jgi:hypothetical protein
LWKKNIAEYEALIQGLRKVVEMQVKILKVFDESEVVIGQVRDTMHCIYSHLKSFQREVWYLKNNFDAFNISHIHWSLNYDDDIWANVASRLIPSDGLMPNIFSMELLYMPLIPDNVTNWRVFEFDQ